MSPMPSGRWFREDYREAVFASSLPCPWRMVALVYADFAGSGSTAWVAPDALRARSGLGRSAVKAGRQGLISSGWLVEVAPAAQHKAATYRLAIPEDQQVGKQPSQGVGKRPAERPEGRETAPEGRETAPEGRETTPTSLKTSPKTSHLVTEESAVYTTTTKEADGENNADTFGARTLASVNRPDLIPAELDLLRKKTEDRIGPVLAPFVVTALVKDQSVRRPGAYAQQMSDDELRVMGQRQRDAASASPRPDPPALPEKCGGCGPARRLEHPDDGRDLGPCPNCHPQRVRAAS